MPFAIEFPPSESHQAPQDAAHGRIILATDHDLFEADLSFWTREQYESSWHANIERILDGADHAALITSISDPASANFIFWWPLYREGETVLVQNQLLFLDELRRPFDPASPWDFVPPRETTDEDGNRISEWPVPVRDLTSFVRPA